MMPVHHTKFQRSVTLPPASDISAKAPSPCVVVALAREALFLRRSWPHRRPFPAAPFPAAFHGDDSRTNLVVETGIGTAAMDKALSWLFSGPMLDSVPYRPPFVLSAGFSGAIVPGLKVGDLILASEVGAADGGRWPTAWPPGPSSFRRGRLLTVSSLVGRPEEKRRLGERTGAVAVDMETAAVARRCTEAGVPFGALRVISDDVDTLLSESLLAVLAGGRVRVAALAAAVLRRPALLAELMRLGAHTRLAARRLAAGLEELLA
jgi:adenosylhomocysteine nucleosidase